MAKKINKKVLIVEDDEDFSSILQTKFISEGFSVAAAKNGEEGVDVAQEEKPNLIISDILMPKMSGIEMARKIREFDRKVPIIFLSNIKDVDYTKDIENSKEFDYLIKSELRINDIVKKVKIKLGLKT